MGIISLYILFESIQIQHPFSSLDGQNLGRRLTLKLWYILVQFGGHLGLAQSSGWDETRSSFREKPSKLHRLVRCLCEGSIPKLAISANKKLSKIQTKYRISFLLTNWSVLHRILLQNLWKCLPFGLVECSIVTQNYFLGAKPARNGGWVNKNQKNLVATLPQFCITL